MYKIYKLIDPISLEIRYIGRTKETLKRRLSKHVRDSKIQKSHKSNWVQFLLKNNLKPLIEIIEADIKNLEEANKLEMYYIKLYKEEGYNLTNSTDGGGGAIGFKHSEEAIKKLKSYSHPHTKETKDNLSKFHFEKFKSDETNKKILDFFRKTPNSSNRKIAQHFNLPDYKISRVLITAKKHKYI